MLIKDAGDEAKRINMSFLWQRHSRGERNKGNHAASSIGVSIMVAMSVICCIGGVALITGVLLSSWHEFSEDGISEKTSLPVSYGVWVVDRNRMILFVAVFVVCAVFASGLTGWYFSRKQLVPMEEVIRLQRNFVADSSHELKTPLSVISLRIDTLEWHLSQSFISESVARDLRDLREDVDGMDAVVNDLLAASSSAVLHESVNVSSLLRHSARSVGPLARASDVGVRVKVQSSDEEVLVSGGEVGLTRCCVALLDNAIAHSPTHADVEIEMEALSDTVIIRVRDHGQGIQSSPERLFQRFVQGDGAEKVNDGIRRGYGLGLALVRDVVRRYGGTVVVERTDSAGTVMAMTLPRK